MIPPEGRDVQCSNCSTTWYQPGRRTDRQPEVEPVQAQTPSEPPPPPSAPPEEPDAAETDPKPTLPERREIEPAIRDILREEAEREARLRRTEAGPVQTQAEMPLSEDADLVRRRAELDAAVDAFTADSPTAAQPIAARDLFPDIDQINSTLRDTGDRSGGEADASDIDTLDTAPRRRKGVRLGFFLVIALAAGGAALYGNADLVIARAPSFAVVLEGYVGAVDAARFWLDVMARRLAGATTDS